MNCYNYCVIKLLIVYAHCEFLTDPDNGDVSHQFPVLGTIARYSCDSDFVLIGEDIRVCTENGSWSGMEPTCEGIIANKLCEQNI